MNSNTQAQKGFKTFLLTLAISLAVFSVIYYVINLESERPSQSIGESEVLSSPRGEAENVPANTLGETSQRPEEESVFEDLANSPAPETQPSQEPQASEPANQEEGQVLAAGPDLAPETTESTVPDTGLSGPTLGIFLTLIILSLVIYIYFVGPRKMALSSFEKDVLDELD